MYIYVHTYDYLHATQMWLKKLNLTILPVQYQVYGIHTWQYIYIYIHTNYMSKTKIYQVAIIYNNI